MRLFYLIFFLMSSCNNISMIEKAKKISKEIIISDGHIDLPYRLKNEGYLKSINRRINLNIETQGNFDIIKAKKGGLDAPFVAIYIPSDYNHIDAYNLADSLIDLVERVVNDNKNYLSLAKTSEDVYKNFKNKLISFPMGMENGSPIGNDLNNLKHFYDRGIRYITLTHAKNNQICDSSYDSTRIWNGLSEFGEKLISEMNKIGMMIDVSHISDKAFDQVIKISRLPVVATHSSPRFFTPGFERNMSNSMIKKLANNKGVILVNFGSSFVNKKSNKIYRDIDDKTEKWRIENGFALLDKEVNKYKNKLIEEKNPFASIEDVLNAIDHIKNLVGINYIGIGSDYDGLGNSLPNNLKDVSSYPNLIEGLLLRGYSREDIEKICYKNFFRVWDINQKGN
jgi:membrane dipeptidase